MRDLSVFLGDWYLCREITDFNGGPSGQMTGRAQFVRAGEADFASSPGKAAGDAGRLLAGDVLMRESGELRLGGGAAMAARRSYIWRQMGNKIAVLFEDGGDFHRFDPVLDAPKAHHVCPPDFYDVAYEFDRWPKEWRAVWRVRGPRKDYESCTTFRRVPL